MKYLKKFGRGVPAKKAVRGQVPEARTFTSVCGRARRQVLLKESKQEGEWEKEISPDQSFQGLIDLLQFGILAFSHSQITGLWRFYFEQRNRKH